MSFPEVICMNPRRIESPFRTLKHNNYLAKFSEALSSKGYFSRGIRSLTNRRCIGYGTECKMQGGGAHRRAVFKAQDSNRKTKQNENASGWKPCQAQNHLLGKVSFVRFSSYSLSAPPHGVLCHARRNRAATPDRSAKHTREGGPFPLWPVFASPLASPE